MTLLSRMTVKTLLLSLVTGGFLAAGFLTATPRPASAQIAGVYDVLGVRADVTAETAAAAQQQALEEAQQRALVTLIDRIVPQEERARLPQLDTALARQLLLDFQIVQENRSDVRYLATVDVRFDPQAVRGLLRGIPVPFAETQSKPLVVLPLYNGGSGALLWSDSNPWLAAWASRPGPGGLVPLVVPLGDLADLVAIDAAKAAAGDEGAFQQVAGNYGAGGVLVTRARPDNPANPQRLVVEAYRNGGQGEPLQLVVAREGAEPVENLYARAAARVDDSLQETWKRQNVIAFDQQTRIAAAVEVYDLTQWGEVIARLRGVNLVDSIRVLRLTQREARLVVSFFGSNDRLATALAQQDLVLIGAPNIGWKIGRAEDRDRISQPTWLGAEFVPPPPPPAAEPAYPETILVQ